MGRRKEGLSRRRIDTAELATDRSLHADGLARHKRGRLRDRHWWSSIRLSGVPLQPPGQHHWGEAVLGEAVLGEAVLGEAVLGEPRSSHCKYHV